MRLKGYLLISFLMALTISLHFHQKDHMVDNNEVLATQFHK